MWAHLREMEYSETYQDDVYEYRHVICPKSVEAAMYRITKFERHLTEKEWRSVGIQQSRGWEHYEIHQAELHIVLFRRPLGTDRSTGIPPEVPDIIVTVSKGACHSDGSADVSCAGLTGRQLLSLKVSRDLSIREFVVRLAKSLNVRDTQVKAVLPDPSAQLLSSFPQSQPLLEVLEAYTTNSQ
eukprot:TRINITY_DN103748_c0_g1_i1.p1 TRINITY_DN103748_c0_g1~~TRINITY_DN103748_c0_g1_i1.p1  ORF type:complete len:184 (+),score=22.02 TRINITY_DN103748_c0_g1_i1:142-693(+)